MEITGTSRADLNGKKGLAIGWDDSRGRYRVHVAGSDMFLKPANLLQAKEMGTPSTMEEAKELAQEAFDEFLGKLKTVLPRGFAPRDAGLAFAGFVLLWKTAGFLRAFALLSVAFVGIVGGGEAFSAAGGGGAGVKAGADAAGDFVAKAVSEKAGRPVTRRQAQLGLVALVAVTFALGARRAPPPPPPLGSFPDYDAADGGSGGGSSTAAAAYARGYEDARAGREFGTSLEAPEDDDGYAPPPGQRVPRGGPPNPNGFARGREPWGHVFSPFSRAS